MKKHRRMRRRSPPPWWALWVVTLLTLVVSVVAYAINDVHLRFMIAAYVIGIWTGLVLGYGVGQDRG